jgi:hypothetical protein
VRILASKSDPFTTVQVRNLALTHMKRIIVCMYLYTLMLQSTYSKYQLDGGGSKELCYAATNKKYFCRPIADESVHYPDPNIAISVLTLLQRKMVEYLQETAIF